MRGDGRIFKRGDTWWIAFYVDGREQRESAKTKDEGTAVKYLRKKLKEVHAHELDPTKPFLTQRDRKRTIADLMDALKADFEIRGKWNPQVRTNVEHVRSAFGNIRATTLAAEQVDEYIQSRLFHGAAKSSINRVTQLLKQAYGLAELLPPRIRRLDESDNVRRGFFTEVEVRRVMANLSDELADFTLFAWLTGMRKGEIASLRWEDSDGDCIRLRAEDAKNGTARLVPLEGELIQLIERRKTARQFKANGLTTMSVLIFHRTGEPIREFRKSWATACRLAGVRRLFHDLRRSACRNMVAAGVAQVTAMQLSGHKTDSMFRRYAIVAENDMRAALRMTQSHLASVREKVEAKPATIN
jgi:integrase